MQSSVLITCPHCFEVFEIPGPAINEVPVTWDYDCEVCCKPMKIRFFLEEDIVLGEAEAE